MPRIHKKPRQRQRHYFREWRIASGLTQDQAMEILGWSQSKISRLERGETPYSQDDVEQAADVYGCSVTDLLTRAPSDPMQKVSGEEAVKDLLRRIDGLPEEAINPLWLLIEGYLRDAARSAQSQPADQPVSATPRRELAR